MAHEPILILDPDPVSRTQLTEILTAAGYDVYGVKAADRLVEAVKASPFPCVIIDVWLPNIDRGALIQAIKEASRLTAVVMMGEKQIFSWLLDAFREGADDFLLKPFDPIEVRERVDKALHRRQQRLEGDKSRQAPPPVPPAVSHTPRRDKAVDDLLRAVLEFQEQSLEVFLDLERKNLDLERDLAALRDPGGGAKFNRDLRILVAHPDAALSQGLEQAVTTFGARMESQAFSGGEVLDRIGNADVDIVLVGSDLPDIPGSIVASTVKSQLDGAEVLMLEAASGGQLRLSAIGEETAPQAVASQQDLLNALKERCRLFRDRQEARQFAHDFKGRHQEYIRSLANLKSRVEKTLEEA